MEAIKTAVTNLVTVLCDLGNDGFVEDALRSRQLGEQDLFDLLMDLSETLGEVEDLLATL